MNEDMDRNYEPEDVSKKRLTVCTIPTSVATTAKTISKVPIPTAGAAGLGTAAGLFMGAAATAGFAAVAGAAGTAA